MAKSAFGKSPKLPKQSWQVKAHSKRVKTKDGTTPKWIGSTQAKRKIPSAFGK